MKKYIIALSLATMLQGLVSCSSEDSADQMTQSGALQMNTRIVPTRSIIEATNFNEGDKVNLFISGAANYVSNAEASLTESTWNISPAVILGRERAGVAGCANLTESIAPDEAGDQNDILLGVSMLSDGYAVNWEKPVANMQFFHVLSRVSFELKQHNGSGHLTKVSLANVENGRSISTEVPVYSIQSHARQIASGITALGLLPGKEYTDEEKNAAQAKYDVFVKSSLSEVESTLSSHYIKAPGTLSKTVDLQLTETGNVVSVLVMPTYASDFDRIQLQLVIDDKTYAVEFPVTSWESNKHYKYPVNIDLSTDKLVPFSIGDVSIEGWGSSTNLEGKVIDTYMD